MRSPGSFVVFLLGSITTWLTTPAAARGRFVLGAKLPDVPGLVSWALNVPWLGPGLVVAFVLLITLRGARRMVSRPLRRRFRMPRLERYRGEIPRRHQDLEI